MKKWLNENELNLVIWSMIIGILLCIYAGYQLVYHPSIEIKRTVITLPEPESKELTAVDGTAGGRL